MKKFLKISLISLLTALLIMCTVTGAIGLLWFGVSVVVSELTVHIATASSNIWLALLIMTGIVSVLCFVCILHTDRREK